MLYEIKIKKMMNIKPRKNKYDNWEVECPFCLKTCFYKASTATLPDPLRDLKRHITNQAKKEALEWYLSQESNGNTKHLEYYKAHTATKKVLIKTFNREYDDDFKIEK